MKLSIKVAVLSIILAADVSFFFFLRIHSPQTYELVFQKMPWPNNVEETFAMIVGFATAILTSVLIVRIIFKHLLKSLQRGIEDE